MFDDVQQWGDELAKAADSPLWALTDHEVFDSLLAVNKVQQILSVLQLRLIREAACRDLPKDHGHRSVAGWLRATLRLDPAAAKNLANTAAALGLRPALEQTLLDGNINLRQATVIAAAVNALPATLAADSDLSTQRDAGGSEGAGYEGADAAVPDAQTLVAQAEEVLISKAAQLPAYQLRRVGDRILEHIAPELAERAEEAALRRAEARAHRRRDLTMSLPDDGIVRISGRLSLEDAAIVRAALDPLCQPRPQEQRNAGQRRADALIDICQQALRTGDLPADGGEPPQIAVTISYDPLRAQLGKGLLPDGERVSAATARRIACDAKVVPYVLGGASQVLDAGRSRRLANGPLRRALTVRDRGCAFPGCDRPPRWCDAHHLVCWTDGGRTDLDNLVLLCRMHHRLIHDPGDCWQIRLGDDRHPVFVPPPWIDPLQMPCRNLYHSRT